MLVGMEDSNRHKQEDEVVGMRVIVDKEGVRKRTEFSGGQADADAGICHFETCAVKLKKRYWWKNCKMM